MNGLKKLRFIFGIGLLITAMGFSFSLFENTNAAADTAKEGKWWRGQVHVHTNWTDAGDAVKWYKRAGYNFAIITDLNYATNVAGLQQFYDAPGRFCVIGGIELNKEVPTFGDKIYDMEGYGGTPGDIKEFKDPLTNYINLPADESAAAAYNRQAKMIRDVGGIPAIAHPNLNWSATAGDILKTDPNLIRHFEVSTAEPGMNDLGGGGHPSAAAASIKNMSLNQAKKRLDEILSTTLGSFYNARNLMVYPPITIGDWSPKNDEGKYRGKISLATAFAASSNVVAVQLGQRAPHPLRGFRRDVNGDAAWHDSVHQQPMAAPFLIFSQPLLSQTPELVVAKREANVIAESA